MEFREQVLDLLADVSENNIVKEQPDIEIFEEGIIDSFKTVELLLEIQNKLDIEVSIMDFDRDEWATPNKIVAVLEQQK
ncbi:D-alanine--poly(phosphoribitol) ligase subunit 2 [Staphylococcus kloosii]|jgi:D-alanine--poly(phosphoribitol) ligase subunit 2|uniref:D-alanyl carrier protein n=1 Tax=Staphylococcus kloosii TaxID=29384 RepID=A0A921GZL7_9STAP|nr:D-alanine--poly(phosphoribitol) ligase subunit 2 [Staphylococcus kloosii]AVQ36710.1 D-alanine--poly(phosphoribitol) ligase subunit 2 [Staphylococcus kloosii]MCD8878154.1 D-alanine--poly(phosphoribitol) ligase subunit 2 [Staphylococcus kloosii]PNZ07444.1 D-alanine--poly(phosphoribitol) ligase subunit 2 [Staphylococcus kloosii]PTJ80096.1 D-alanine--poly(phosphoribitol) ligase subunit 2 [Staphylococcus kloosii]SUM49807.1 D-alanine--poly(phosphoribitol) ligase subunit 2 [Staphylococcus kloosii]